MSHPSKFVTIARIMLFTVIAALLSFALTLLISIVTLLVVSTVRHQAADFTIAYSRIAPTVAVVAVLVAFVFSARMEIREYRRASRSSDVGRSDQDRRHLSAA